MKTTMRGALKVVFGMSVFGVCFSGYLSYVELFGPSAAACPSLGAPGTVFGYPACVYGFVMYLFLTLVSAVALRSKQ